MEKIEKQESLKNRPTIELREDVGRLDFPNLYINGSQIGYVKLSVTDPKLNDQKKLLREAFAPYSPKPYTVGDTTPGNFVEIKGVEYLRISGPNDNKNSVAMLNMKTYVWNYMLTSAPCLQRKSK